MTSDLDDHALHILSEKVIIVRIKEGQLYTHATSLKFCHPNGCFCWYSQRGSEYRKTCFTTPKTDETEGSSATCVESALTVVLARELTCLRCSFYLFVGLVPCSRRLKDWPLCHYLPSAVQFLVSVHPIPYHYQQWSFLQQCYASNCRSSRCNRKERRTPSFGSSSLPSLPNFYHNVPCYQYSNAIPCRRSTCRLLRICVHCTSQLIGTPFIQITVTLFFKTSVQSLIVSSPTSLSPYSQRPASLATITESR